MCTKQCYKCKAVIVFKPEEEVKLCAYCHAPNSRPKSNPASVSLMDYANERRNIGHFSEAENAYDEVLKANLNEHEARWGKLLCQYGVMYVESEAGERVITCRRRNSASILMQHDYKMILLQVPEAVRDGYQKDAEYINRVQAQIDRLWKIVTPCDVFLCYKETAETNQKTEDSQIAREIYNNLRNSGYKVFYAPESLKKYSGENYEAALFVAIEKCPVMLVIGTKKEYFISSWVRSEWQRFLDCREKDSNRLLLPLCRDPKDLPDEFNALFIEGLKMEDSYMLDLKKRLDSVLPPDPLFMLASMYLSGGDFQKADSYLDRLLENQPMNAKAWFAKAMIHEQIQQEDDFMLVTRPLTDNFFYINALKLADGELKERIESYLDLNKEIVAAGKAFQYEIQQDRTIRITGYTGAEKECAIPSHIDGYLVAAIGPSAFAGCQYLQRITIPNSVAIIGSSAFKACGRLVSVTLAEGLKEIGYGAFYQCGSLSQVLIPEGTESIGSWAFASCVSLTSVNVPDSITRIGPNAFDCCTGLTIYSGENTAAEKYALDKKIPFVSRASLLPSGQVSSVE